MTELHPVCTRFHQAVELIGARWSGAILRALFTGQYRYAEIKAAIPGISDTMLAARLRELEGAGIIGRIVNTAGPVVVEYRLTEQGTDLAPVMDAIRDWSHKWIPLPGEPAPDRSQHTNEPTAQPAGDHSAGVITSGV